jgi:hypothetical protein
MVFTKRLREGIRRGRIRCTVRIWKYLHVKVGGRYPMEDGYVVVDEIESIRMKDITSDLARESGFGSVEDLLQIAKHGPGANIYLIRFHFLPPGAWDTQARIDGADETPTLLERIERAPAPRARRRPIRGDRPGD